MEIFAQTFLIDHLFFLDDFLPPHVIAFKQIFIHPSKRQPIKIRLLNNGYFLGNYFIRVFAKTNTLLLEFFKDSKLTSYFRRVVSNTNYKFDCLNMYIQHNKQIIICEEFFNKITESYPLKMETLNKFDKYIENFHASIEYMQRYMLSGNKLSIYQHSRINRIQNELIEMSIHIDGLRLRAID